ncbi:hypothetical protein [Glutamicibacter sp. V16R2B1]|uniref:hypothetical protein n=1 Tax=Glutamicibacter sp. V16R2B1 TaxID=2036207 RepID=UPI0010FDC467|nr:hypothetical protein [Glutamicibacter sp. V16R2B1]TLK54769.1 hypothetical protein FDN03_04670 [Glutamicibacter sp. V16R2B1]
MKEIKEADEKTLMCVMGCMTDGPALPVEALKNPHQSPERASGPGARGVKGGSGASGSDQKIDQLQRLLIN